MKKFNPAILTLLILTVIHTLLQAVPATPFPIVRTLPDGSQLTVYLKGDEFFNYYLSEDGFLIREDDTGYFQYGILQEDGLIRSTGVRVNVPDTRTTAEKEYTTTLTAFPDFSLVRSQRREARMAKQLSSASTSFPRTGSPRSLVILVNFSDVAFTTPDSRTAFTNLLNEPGYSDNGGTGSARDYFRSASFGISSPEFDVVGPFLLPENRAFYGGNALNGDDQRPREMIQAACLAADNAGVDFAVYDTDYDGIVDNVFVYYAGHNEAEGGPKESIWPHRWELNQTLKLDNKLIKGYACSSELRSNSGRQMCGIGTFAHEFGHVYGLADYYVTAGGSNHHTLYTWNIMDAGTYLNEGRTPPTYAAFDRFFLGWLTPTLLKSPRDVRLPDLQSTNIAYMLTATKTHSMKGDDPDPKEFILLEYRSLKGWDSFLPNSGMLITRIVYTSSDWYNNTPNNKADAMGVDILEADGLASASLSSLRGDPFPGSMGVTAFYPTTRSGSDMQQAVTSISEEADAVTFKFMGGSSIIAEINSSQELLRPFHSILTQQVDQQIIKVSGTNLSSFLTAKFSFNKHFEISKDGQSWYKSMKVEPVAGSVSPVELYIRYNPTDASFAETHFEYLLLESDNVDTQQILLTGKSTRPIYVIPPVAEEVTINTTEKLTARWNKVYDATGYYLSFFSKMPGKSVHRQGFDNGLNLPVGWNSNAGSILKNPAYAGDSIPSVELRNNNEFIETGYYLSQLNAFSFYIRSIGENTGKIYTETLKGDKWEVIDSFDIQYSLNNRHRIQLNGKDYRKFRVRFLKGTGTVAIDDPEAEFTDDIYFYELEKWITDTVYHFREIDPVRNYNFSVRASDRTLYPNHLLKYENITDHSNIVEVKREFTNLSGFTNNKAGFRVYTDGSGLLHLSADNPGKSGGIIYIYDSSGRLLKSLSYDKNLFASIKLPVNQLYIIRAEGKALKIFL